MLNTFLVYSILKCEFGWNGVQPEALQTGEIERAMVGQTCASKCANKIAILLDANGAKFRQRIDGRPNTRKVIGGVVWVLA